MQPFWETMDAILAGSVSEAVLLYKGYNFENNCELPIQYIPTVGKPSNITDIKGEIPKLI